jgi:hypothetical protein
MSSIRKLIGSGEVKVSGICRFWGAMLVPLLMATQALGRDITDQLQTEAKS